VARALGGRARLRLGDIAAADLALREALTLADRSGLVQTQIVAASQLAMAAAVQGKLRAASRYGRQALAIADRFGASAAAERGWAQLALAFTACERNHPDTAERLLDGVADLAGAEPELLLATQAVRARLYHSTGRLADGLRTLLRARYTYPREPVTTSAVDQALVLTEAELRLGVRQPVAARRLIADGTGEPGFTDWSSVIQAAALLMEGRVPAAASRLEVVLARTARLPSACRVQAALLSASAGRRLGDTDQVLRGLRLAVETAAPEDIRRPFLTGLGIPALLPTYRSRLNLRRSSERQFAADLAAVLSAVIG
jgi:LuxR family maltose regulon positive regulatory protein